MDATKKGLTANIIGAVLLLAGINLDPYSLQLLCDYLGLLGVVIEPTKVTAVLGIIGLIINQVLIRRAQQEPPQ